MQGSSRRAKAKVQRATENVFEQIISCSCVFLLIVTLMNLSFAAMPKKQRSVSIASHQKMSSPAALT